MRDSPSQLLPHHPNQHHHQESNFYGACRSDILPHLQNTFSPFEYLESGLIKIKDEVVEPSRSRVVALVELVGLDRRPGHPRYSTKDDRWQERKQAWELSQKYRQKYIAGKCDIETIIDLSLTNGFWSIWMSTFEDFLEVQRELIDSFQGTRLELFTHIV